MAKTSFIATGDAFMTRRLPEGGYPGFEQVRSILGRYQVRFNNLEFTAHDCEGYPAAFSGGTWAMAEPEMLDDLKAFGFNLYNTANNHSLDYSHGGLLATLAHMRRRDMPCAGTGENLAAAAAPVYLETEEARVALLGATATFHDSDIAGAQSPSLPGRPGVNGLRVRTECTLSGPDFEALERIVGATGLNAVREYNISNGFVPPVPEGQLDLKGIRFLRGAQTVRHTAPDERDMKRMEEQIREACRQADYVLVSIHAHEFPDRDPAQPAEFLVEFAHRCIDAGACAVLGHGPHELRPVEIYKGRPVFYSLGNFIFQTDTVRRQPAEAFTGKGLPADGEVGQLMDLRSRNGTRGYCVLENIWRSVMAGFEMEDGRLTGVTLYPIALGMGQRRSRIGWPRPADESVLRYLADLSAPYGTRMEIRGGTASVRLD